MRKHLLATTLALSIAAALPATGLIPSAHAQAAPPASMVAQLDLLRDTDA